MPSGDLRGSEIPLDRHADPFQGYGVVDRDTLAPVVHQADVQLSALIALLRQRQPFAKGGFIIAAVVGAGAVLEVGAGDKRCGYQHNDDGQKLDSNRHLALEQDRRYRKYI